MKKVLSIFLLICAFHHLNAQGTIRLSNIGNIPWIVDGSPLNKGALVSLAVDHALVGPIVPALGAGFFSGGVVVLEDFEPGEEVTLSLATGPWFDNWWIYGNFFQVTLGDQNNPLLPPASIPTEALEPIVAWPEPNPMALMITGIGAMVSIRYAQSQRRKCRMN